MSQSIETKEYSYLNTIDKDTLDAILMIANTLDENTLDALLDLIAGGGASGGGGLILPITEKTTESGKVITLDLSYNELKEYLENGTVFISKTDNGNPTHGEYYTTYKPITEAVLLMSELEDGTMYGINFVDLDMVFSATDPDEPLTKVDNS